MRSPWEFMIFDSRRESSVALTLPANTFRSLIS